MSLTTKQRELMLYIQRYTDAHGGVSPSYEEMTEALDLVSKSGVLRLLRGLEERGFIARIPYRARAIEIIRRVRDPDAPPITDDGRQAFKALILEMARAPEIDGWLWRRKADQLLRQYP